MHHGAFGRGSMLPIKDEIFGYVDSLMRLIVYCYPSREAVPPAKLATIEAVVARLDRERFVERTIDESFKEKPTEADMERVLCMVAPLKDEFQKGQLYQGLLHYRDQVERMAADVKNVLARYILSELRRYAAELEEGSISEDGFANLEFACDVARYVVTETYATDMTVAITALLEHGNSTVNYYAASTLLAVGGNVPDRVIIALAEDIEYADLTYELLSQHRMTDRFPAALADPVYLAKSHMIRWLAYPTELGKHPDEIEFLGQTKKKGEVFHIFLYKSDSENLGEELKGQWLIGWAGSDGGTFSNFDLYADFEKKTVEKTVRYIRRKLL